MSFVLEFRKKMQADARKTTRKKTAVKKSEEGFAFLPAKRNADTGGNRRRVLAALSLAAIILSVFNSGAMVQYAGGLGYNNLTMQIISASERWHQIMEETRMTALVEEIRGAVTKARQSSWQDLAFGKSPVPADPWPVVPAKAHPQSDTPEKSAPAEVTPDSEQTAPEGPVMRAAVEPASNR